eukprot:186689_1
MGATIDVGLCDLCSVKNEGRASNVITRRRHQGTSTVTYADSSSDESNTNSHHRTESRCEGEQQSDTPTMDSHSILKIQSGFREAVQHGNDSLVMYFVEEYPYIQLLHLDLFEGDTALHIAIQNLSYNLIYYLLNHGISPNTQSRTTKETALHAAVRTREINIVALLMEFEADVNIENSKHQTAIEIATNNRDEDIIELLSNNNWMNCSQYLLNAQTTLDINEMADMVLCKDISAASLQAMGSRSPSSHFRDWDQDLDEKETLKMEAIRVALHNPFSKIQRTNTKQALHEINALTIRKCGLPVLEAWMDKQQPRPPYLWQRRWVMVKETYILWSERQTSIQNPRGINERKAFNGSINLMAIESVDIVAKTKKRRKFSITITKERGKKSRTYMWRCVTTEDR